MTWSVIRYLSNIISVLTQWHCLISLLSSHPHPNYGQWGDAVNYNCFMSFYEGFLYWFHTLQLTGKKSESNYEPLDAGDHTTQNKLFSFLVLYITVNREEK